MAIGQFIRLRLLDDRVIAPEVVHLRAVARTVLGTGRDYGLLAFRCVDSHLHIGSKCDRPDAGQFARRVEISLSQQLPHDVGFQRARIDPIVDQRHLVNAFDYTLGQDQRHDYRRDPYHDASALPDLLRFRAGPLYLLRNVETYLPRVRSDDLTRHLGPLDLQQPITNLAPLAEAAAAAAALPDLRGNTKVAVLARAAAAEVGIKALNHGEVAALMDWDRHTVTNLLKDERRPPRRLVEAVELQLSLRQLRPAKTL